MYPRLRISRNVSSSDRERIARWVRDLPALSGAPITLAFRPDLTAHRGRLLSGNLKIGTAVHAAAFIRERRIVLESALLRRPGKLRLILVHELFHFVWPRLGNPLRQEYAAILRNELAVAARGELGESALVKKEQLGPGEKGWRDYVCESFCDTAAWCYSGKRRSADFTLAERWRVARHRWFISTFSGIRWY